MKKNIIIFLTTILIFSMSIFFFMSPDNNDTRTIKIGGIFDMTGETSDIGLAYSHGVIEYINYVNFSGGINGRKVELIYTDYKYQIPLALNFYKKITTIDKVLAIIGWGTGDTLALAPVVNQDKIPYTSASFDESFSNPAKYPYNFIIGPTYQDQIKILMNHILKVHGKNAKIAIFYHNSAFGKAPLEAAKIHSREIGLNIFENVAMLEDLNIKAKISELEKKKVVAIIVQNLPYPTYTIANACFELKSKIKLYGLIYSVNQDIIKFKPEAFDQFTHASPFAFYFNENEYLKSILKFNSNINSMTRRFYMGWVNAMVLLEGIKRVKGELTGEKIKNSLETITDFSTNGLTDNITFNLHSHKGLSRLKLYIYDSQEKKFIPITGYIKVNN
ncbi:MAG: ABC transporter substrate-binding protein [Exilispira sp.]